MFESELNSLRKLGVRGALTQILAIASVVASGLMGWKTLGLLTGTESPVVVVGDILLLTSAWSWNGEAKYEVGDITVYKLPDSSTPIVHRVISTHDKNITTQLLLTKGDNNAADDRGLYPRGMEFVEKDAVVGKVKGFLPYIGYVTLVMQDYPAIKYALLGGLGLSLLFQKE